MSQKDKWIVAARSGDEIHHIDMVYINGEPHAVWEWHQDAGNEYPGVTTALDPRNLQEMKELEGVDFAYLLPLEAP